MTKAQRTPDPQQLGMDFSSRATERFALLRQLDLGISSEASRIGYLLELLAALAGDGELDWPLARISQRLRLPEITLRRTIELAERIGVITVRRLERSDGTYGANALAVHWSRIASGQIDPIAAYTGNRRYHQRSTGADGPLRLIGRSAPVDRTSSPGILPQGNSLPPPPPPRTNSPVAPDASGAGGMAAAVVRLCELGVADASAAVRQAAASGVTADVVLALAEHFAARPGAWGPGALHYRVRSAVPGQPLDAGWPPPAKGWMPARERQLRQQAQADQQAARRQASAALEALLSRREQEFGPRLDALAEAELAALVEGNLFFAERLKRSGRHSPLVREFLLARLDELSGENSQAAAAAPGGSP